MEGEGDTSKPDTPAEAMQSSESEFEETVKKEEPETRPTGSGGRTPASPPNS